MSGKRAVLMILGAVLVIKEASPAPQFPIYFKDGTIGVNFLGFKASAGLNSLLNGGGLHAEAETPYGQKAGAGLGGIVKPDGSVGGQLFAGATAGGNVKAAAGLGGAVEGGESPKAVGGLYSAASAGPAKAGKSVAGGVSDVGSYSIVENVADAPAKVVKRDEGSKPAYYVRGHRVKFDKFIKDQINELPSVQRVDVPIKDEKKIAKATATKTNPNEIVGLRAGDGLNFPPDRPSETTLRSTTRKVVLTTELPRTIYTTRAPVRRVQELQTITDNTYVGFGDTKSNNRPTPSIIRNDIIFTQPTTQKTVRTETTKNYIVTTEKLKTQTFPTLTTFVLRSKEVTSPKNTAKLIFTTELPKIVYSTTQAPTTRVQELPTTTKNTVFELPKFDDIPASSFISNEFLTQVTQKPFEDTTKNYIITTETPKTQSTSTTTKPTPRQTTTLSTTTKPTPRQTTKLSTTTKPTPRQTITLSTTTPTKSIRIQEPPTSTKKIETFEYPNTSENLPSPVVTNDFAQKAPKEPSILEQLGSLIPDYARPDFPPYPVPEFVDRSFFDAREQETPRFIKTKYIVSAQEPGGSGLASFFSSPSVESRVAVEAQSGTKSRTFFDDIFNIPISTLGAVSRFLSNSVPAKASGNIVVQKSFTTNE